MKQQWFDELFDADKKDTCIPSRESINIETVEFFARKQREQEAETVLYADLIRQEECAL